MVGKCRDIKTSGQLISDNGVAMANDGWCLVTGKLIFDSSKFKYQQNQALMALIISLALPTTIIRP